MESKLSIILYEGLIKIIIYIHNVILDIHTLNFNNAIYSTEYCLAISSMYVKITTLCHGTSNRMRMRTTPNAQARILKLAYSCLSASEDAGSGMATIDDEFDEIVRSAPDAMFDCRTYYWPNYGHQFISHTASRSLHSLLLFLRHPHLVRTM